MRNRVRRSSGRVELKLEVGREHSGLGTGTESHDSDVGVFLARAFLKRERMRSTKTKSPIKLSVSAD